jgi:hypothetical protein
MQFGDDGDNADRRDDQRDQRDGDHRAAANEGSAVEAVEPQARSGP